MEEEGCERDCAKEEDPPLSALYTYIVYVLSLLLCLLIRKTTCCLSVRNRTCTSHVTSRGGDSYRSIVAEHLLLLYTYVRFRQTHRPARTCSGSSSSSSSRITRPIMDTVTCVGTAHSLHTAVGVQKDSVHTVDRALPWQWHTQ